MRRKHRLDAVAQRQIRVADDAGADLGLAVDAAGAHGGDAVDELGLADRAQLFGAVGAIHRAGLHEDGRDDVVAAVGVGQQLVEQIAPAGSIPEMVMRIDDRQVGLEDRLVAPVEPILADGNIGGRGGRRGHWRGPLGNPRRRQSSLGEMVLLQFRSALAILAHRAAVCCASHQIVEREFSAKRHTVGVGDAA